MEFSALFLKVFVNLLINYLLSILNTHASINGNSCTFTSGKERNHELSFHMLKSCQRSTLKVIEMENVQKEEECIHIAERSKGLAFNYAPSDRRKLKNYFESPSDFNNGTYFPIKSKRRNIYAQPAEFFNCLVLECPENENFITMVNDSRFNYYSLYTNPPPPESSTCLPGVGIFQLNLIPLNYSSACHYCVKKSRGALAHVISELRTNSISAFLKNVNTTEDIISPKLAYIGLNATFSDSRDYMTSEWEKLSCFLYRAWHPGHPFVKKTDKTSCVTISTDGTWKAMRCERKLAYICEIYTSGPADWRTYENACTLYNPII